MFSKKVTLKIYDVLWLIGIFEFTYYSDALLF